METNTNPTGPGVGAPDRRPSVPTRTVDWCPTCFGHTNQSFGVCHSHNGPVDPTRTAEPSTVVSENQER